MSSGPFLFSSRPRLKARELGLERADANDGSLASPVVLAHRTRMSGGRLRSSGGVLECAVAVPGGVGPAAHPVYAAHARSCGKETRAAGATASRRSRTPVPVHAPCLRATASCASARAGPWAGAGPANGRRRPAVRVQPAATIRAAAALHIRPAATAPRWRPCACAAPRSPVRRGPARRPAWRGTSRC